MFGEESVSYQPKLKYITVTVDNDKAVVNLKSYEGIILTCLIKSILLLALPGIRFVDIQCFSDLK